MSVETHSWLATHPSDEESQSRSKFVVATVSAMRALFAKLSELVVARRTANADRVIRKKLHASK